MRPLLPCAVCVSVLLMGAASFAPRQDEPVSPQEKPKSIDALPQAPTIVTGGKAQRILHVGQRVRFVSANGVRTYDGIFAIEDALGPWILVRDEERNWWVNLSAIEGVEVVP